MRILNGGDLLARYRDVRFQSERFASFLEPEDCVVQSMPDVSPTRWHLAHTTWFFETFVLSKGVTDYPRFSGQFETAQSRTSTDRPRASAWALMRAMKAGAKSFSLRTPTPWTCPNVSERTGRTRANSRSEVS